MTLFEEHPVGALRMAEVISQPTIIEHTAEDVARAETVIYFFILQIEGSSLNSQDDRVAKLASGDFSLCTTARPYQMTIPEPGRRIVVAIPDGLLRRHLACPDDVVAVQMHGGRGMNMLLGNFVQSFWSCRSEAAQPTVAFRMSYTILDLIAAAYSSAPRPPAEVVFS
jgi:AraC-binding-like domain